MAAYPVRQQAGPVEPSWVEQLLGLLAVPYQWAGRELGGEYEAMAGWTAPFAAIANAPRFLGNALGQAGQSLQEAGEGAPLVTQENVSPIPGPWNYRINQRGADVVGAGLDVAGSGLLARGVRHVPDLAQGLLRHVDDLAANPAAVSRIFGGMGAKTADTDALARAFAMEEAGEGREAIRQATGWFRAPWDKKWRFEIDDSAALVNPSGEGLARVSNDIPYAMDIDYGPGGLMEHPRFAAAYDQPFLIPHTRVKPSNTMLGSNRGAFDPNSGELTYFAPQAADSARSTGLHEMQHAVQNSENFARGGNPKDMDVGSLKRDAVASLRDEINRLYTVGGKEQIEKADRLGRTLNYILNGIENDQVKMYRRLAGEAEARLVQQRRNLTPQQRGLLDPIEQMDTMLKQEGIRGGIDDLIVRYGDGPAMSAPIPDELPFGLPERIQAFRTARTNAALPVEQGGLGLGSANTAAERARAMGFDVDALHGTKSPDIEAFDPLMAVKKGSSAGPNPRRVFATANPEGANDYAMAPRQWLAMRGDQRPTNWAVSIKPAKDWTEEDMLDRGIEAMFPTKREALEYAQSQGQSGLLDVYRLPDSPTVMPLKMSLGNKPIRRNAKGKDWEYVRTYDESGYINPDWGRLKPVTKTGAEIRNVVDPASDATADLLQTIYIADPKNVRSRFAAFDPARRHEADLLASWLLPLVGGAGLLGYFGQGGEPIY